jgi:hypothetical protein
LLFTIHPLKNLIALLTVCFLMGNISAHAQVCPVNIGFETGGFNNWKTSIGTATVVANKNSINLSNSVPTNNRHTINSSKVAIDKFGKFPVLAPNGSNFSVRLGNDGLGAQAEGLSYLITVPANQESFVITYQYAVVLEDPGHLEQQQPRFTAKVLDLSTNTYITCASFDYVATSSLPGFKISPVVGSSGSAVIYKDWTPVTINLSGYQGKQLLLEFKTADCTQTGHFGYAYIDVNENCNNIIQGNSSCLGSIATELKGPSGYQFYKWYNADRSIYYGEGETIAIQPQLNVGDKVVLDLIPYTGFGCDNTVSTTIVQGVFELDLVPVINACKNDVLDLSSSQYVLNKHNQVVYTCYTDAALKNPVDITKIKTSGTYYIKAVSPIGCTVAKSINVIFHEIVVDVLASIKDCMGTTIDLTSPLIQKNVPSALTVSYFIDAGLTIPLADPKKIVTKGDYYIKYESIYCSISKKVSVDFNPLPIIKVTNPTPVCSSSTIDLTTAAVTAGSDVNLQYNYYKDAALTTELINPKAISITGDYFIKGTNIYGCSTVAKVFVEIYPLPTLVIRKIEPVCFPRTIDLTDPYLYVGTTAGVKYTYVAKNNKLIDPKNITESGTYIITIETPEHCTATKTVDIVINPQPILVINQPKKVFITQSVDITKAEIIKGSTGYSLVNYWKDDLMTIPLTNPKQITETGQYYISLTNSYGCTAVGMVQVTTVEWPKISVPTAFTPLKGTNNTLYPFFEGIKKLNSFKIYNKWGNLVFVTSSMDPAQGWNGTFKGALQPFETYSWYAEGINLLDYIFTTKGKTILIP